MLTQMPILRDTSLPLGLTPLATRVSSFMCEDRISLLGKPKPCFVLKFIYYEKATKSFEISTIDLTVPT